MCKCRKPSALLAEELTRVAEPTDGRREEALTGHQMEQGDYYLLHVR